MGLAIPQTTQDVIHRVQPHERNPVLQLDKLSPVGKQEVQKAALEEVLKAIGDPELLKSLRQRRQQGLAGMTAWKCKTTGPLTLHLSRASALENAGICLHPLYGFVYLPGSGLKGMARAYAETIWLAGQADKHKAWRQIEDVFGWAPGSDVLDKGKEKPWKPADAQKHGKSDAASAGSVVFHDAWPEKWPGLLVDIVNNHHGQYYDGKDDPGDWEDPVPVYFLAVGPGNIFDFALSGRRSDTDARLVGLAREWLTGALFHLGAGAKTNAGYGRFAPVEGAAPVLPKSERMETFECEVELVTPAFLAGANQKVEDCDLRPATLRGQLRWWWRTMHAGHMASDKVLALESSIWGAASRGGAISVAVERVTAPSPQFYSKQAKANMGPAQKTSPLGIPGFPANKVTQGLWYQSYGMDDAGKKRAVLEPGARYRVRMVARASSKDRDGLPAGLVLEQAKAALWLLCCMGGVGAKSRKGFGCLKAIGAFDGYSLDGCKKIGRDFRDRTGIKGGDQNPPQSPSLDHGLYASVSTQWQGKDVWFALDQIGFSTQHFAKKLKHNVRKKGLGLPRRIGSPVTGVFKGNLNRHASPTHFHLDLDSERKIVVGISAFPSDQLSGFSANRELLAELLEYLKTDLATRGSGNKPVAPTGGGGGGSHFGAHPSGLTPNQTVSAVLLEEKTKKGGWKARHEASGKVGPIQNTKEVSPDAKFGDTVTLVVASVGSDGKSADFRWPKK